jgi:hypothetical protein
MEFYVDAIFTLKKYPGKGGWTYVEIPFVKPDKKMPFGWVQVKGSVDGYPIRQYKLMPMGGGQLFLPVKSAIRKAIKKEEGDQVHVHLVPDDSPVEIPDELLLCLLDAPEAYAFFQTLTDSNKKYYIDWIYEAKRPETRVNRIVSAIERLEKGLKMYDNSENNEL